MGIFDFEGRKPLVPESCYVDDSATIIGLVELGEECFVGPGARIKGDYGRIVIGAGSSVQENCVIHARPDCETVVGSGVTVGHGAILHGSNIADNVVIGMGAIVPDDVVVGEFCIVAEGAVLANGSVIPPRSVVMGVPGKVRSELGPGMEKYISASAGVYRDMAGRYRTNLSEINRGEAAAPR